MVLGVTLLISVAAILLTNKSNAGAAADGVAH
jgi:hypothetical protein